MQVRRQEEGLEKSRGFAGEKSGSRDQFSYSLVLWPETMHFFMTACVSNIIHIYMYCMQFKYRFGSVP